MKKIDLSDLPPEFLEQAQAEAEAEGFDGATPSGAYRLTGEELPYFLAHLKAGGDPEDFDPSRLKTLSAFAQTLPTARRSKELAELRDSQPENVAIRREIFCMAVAMFLRSPGMTDEVMDQFDQFIRVVFPEAVKGNTPGGMDSELGQAIERHTKDIETLAAFREKLFGVKRPEGTPLQ